MKQAAQTAWASLMLWKLAITRLLVHCLVVAATGYLGAMGNQRWTELDGDSRFKLMLGIFVTMASTVVAFLDKSSAKLSTGGTTPPDTGDTVNITKT